MTECNTSTEERRLWIGNLDIRISEFQLIKILQKFGHIEKFDLLFHRTGILNGQPRGYAFVTYKTVQESTLVMDKLNGKMIGNKTVSVRLAKNINYDEIEKPKPKVEIPVLAAGSNTEPKKIISKQIAIQAIEAKLKLLENKNSTDDFMINKSVTNETSIIQKYQYNKNQPQSHTRIHSSKYIAKARHKNNHSSSYSRPFNRP